ncbi:hypothetical protein [Streptomyces sp. NPDC001070]
MDGTSVSVEARSPSSPACAPRPRPAGDCPAEATPHDEDDHGRHGRPFAWARLGDTVLLRTTETTRWPPSGLWTAAGRPFLAPRRAQAHHHDEYRTAARRPEHP